MLVLLHPDARSMEGDALGFQAQPLFQGIFTGQRDLSARSYYPMPRQPTPSSQRPDHLARTAGKTRCLSDAAIRGYFSFGNFADGVADYVEHGLLRTIPL